MYALVAESCKHQDTLERLIESTEGLKSVDRHLAKVLITELLWGKGYLKPQNARAIQTILGLENLLRQTLQGVSTSHPVTSVHIQGMKTNLSLFSL